MSGGSMDWLYLRVRDAEFKLSSPERVAFRHHLMLVAKALRSIEWNDSGDGDDQEVPNIMACIPLLAEENKLLRAEIKRLRAALQESACACPSFEEHCASTWARQDGCAHMTARKALEGKP